MKSGPTLTLHAILFMAAGIAFALYGPLMLNLYGVTAVEGGNDLLYWHIASFARLFGAALFLAGLLLFALRSAAADLPPAALRGVAFSLAIGDAILLVVALTQQTSVWSSSGGWVTAGIFFALLILSGWLLVSQSGRDEALRSH